MLLFKMLLWKGEQSLDSESPAVLDSDICRDGRGRVCTWRPGFRGEASVAA